LLQLGASIGELLCELLVGRGKLSALVLKQLALAQSLCPFRIEVFETATQYHDISRRVKVPSKQGMNIAVGVCRLRACSGGIDIVMSSCGSVHAGCTRASLSITHVYASWRVDVLMSRPGGKIVPVQIKDIA
jgi:hypothetical protein